MQKHTDFLTAADGIKLYTVHWSPDAAATATRDVVLMVHGLHEHIERYTHVAQALTDAGYEVYGFDNRGHGRSAGERGHIASYHDTVDDVLQVYQHIKAEQPKARVFLFGHSMGSLITMMYTLKHQDTLAGWISSGSPVKLDESVSGLLEPILIGLSRILPKAHLVPLDPKTIARDPEVVQAYIDDPLVLSDKPARVGTAIGITREARAARGQLHTLKLPILILHGGDDTVTPVSGSHYLYDHAGSADKTLEIYPGLYHEVLNEKERDNIIQFIVNWLREH